MTPLYWSSPHGSLAGVGAVDLSDPGMGPDRYRRAAETLSVSGRRIAFASFTFDPRDPFSLVAVPDGVDRRWEPTGGVIPPGTVLDDGSQDWASGFLGAISALDAGGVTKVVLARQVRAVFAGPIPVEAVLARLISFNLSSHVFSVDGLVGASPELLVRVRGRQASSLVLAGTARSAEGLKTAVIHDEHQQAAASVEEAMGPLTTGLTRESSPIVFGKISHLATRFEATTKSGVGILDLVTALHPTAALCGRPRDAALELIRALEPRSRGRYGGPVGWFDDRGGGEFAVAIRCGQVLDDEVTLYAGGGLVRDADRAYEWVETEMKLGPMLRALGLSQD